MTKPRRQGAPAHRPQGGGRPPTTTRYLRSKRPTHLLADTEGMVRVHRAVLYDKIGPGPATCHWCGRELAWKADGIRRVVADHLDANTRNNAPSNLVASCRTCNVRRAKRDDFLTHCGRGHRFTAENTYLRPDNKSRQCRTCKHAQFKAWWKKNGNKNKTAM